MTSYDAYSISIHVRTVNLEDISHKKGVNNVIKLSGKNKSVIRLCQNLYVQFK